MANWATVQYVIEGSKEDLFKIDDAIGIDLEKDVWEGNVLTSLGMSQEEVNDYSLRGFIQDSFQEHETVLKIYAEEAWNLTEFKDCLKKLFPNITIYWYIEEPGYEIYETNDIEGKYFSDRFILFAETNDPEYFESEDRLFEYLKKESGINDYFELDDYNARFDTPVYRIYEIYEINE